MQIKNRQQLLMIVAGAAAALSSSRNYSAGHLYALLDQAAMPKGTVVGVRAAMAEYMVLSAANTAPTPISTAIVVPTYLISASRMRDWSE